ncbi:MAG: EAL domain-containing protein [Lautropia sp.]|nr:EAL domain-containing protein [Lautropia sp.]
MTQDTAFRQRLGASQLAAWGLLLIAISYVVWIFAYPMAYSKPDDILQYRILASSKNFNELTSVLGSLREQGASLKLKAEGSAPKTLWVLARIPTDMVERTRVLHIANRSVVKGDAVILDEFGQALLYAHFNNEQEPVNATRALPGYAVTLPDLPLPLPAGHRRFSGEHDLTVVLRLELTTAGHTLLLNLWDEERFVIAQRQIEAQGTMLGGILVLLGLTAFVAAQLAHIRVVRLLAFWLGARAAFLLTRGGYLQLWLGSTAGSALGLGLEQMSQMSYPCACAALMWGLMENRLQGHRFGTWLHGMSIVSTFALLVSSFLSPEVFQTLLYLVGGAVVVTVAGLMVVNFSRSVSLMSIWYLCTPLLDGMVAGNILLYRLGITSAPVPWLDLQSTTLIAIMNTSTAVIGYLAAERSHQLRTQEAAMTALGRYQATYRAVPIGLLSFDRDHAIERYNEVAVRLFDVPDGSLETRMASGDERRETGTGADNAALDRAHVDTLTALNEAFPQDLSDRIHQELENFEEADFIWRLEHAAGGHRWLRVQAQKTDTGHDVSLSDVTALKQAEHHLIRESQHDKLTGALNRHGLEIRLEELLKDAQHLEQVALCYIDLDRFKVLNDVFGHQAGDAVLIDVVRRLRSRLGNQVEIARMGGDEFALLFHGTEPPHRLQAYRALDAIAGRPFVISPKRFAVTASVGMSSAVPGLRGGQLVDRADSACREAKRKGRNQVVIYQENEQDGEHERHQVELDVLDRLRKTKEFHDFELAIQPVVGLGDSNQLGGEILLRHRTPDGTLRSPSGLIEAAIYRGEMATIDRWVLTETLRWLAKNERAFRALDFISLNLSAEALSDEAFKTHLLGQVRRFQQVAAKLVIEIDETVAMQDGYMMKRLIGSLRQLGARAALDNVGSGFVNLSAIGEMGVAYLKMDGSFTESLIHQGSGQAVLRTLTVLAHELGIASVAKSVQTSQVLSALEDIRVDYGQGLALGAPMPLREFEKLACIGTGVELSEAFIRPQVAPLTRRQSTQGDVADPDAFESSHR